MAVRRSSTAPGRLRQRGTSVLVFAVAFLCVLSSGAGANPANRIGLDRYFEKFLARRLNACTTCHLPLQPGKSPDSLQNFPHNFFGARLARLGIELRAQNRRADIASRIRLTAREDSDGDGIDNLTELLLGHSPGDRTDFPTAQELKVADQKKAAFARFLAAYRWLPFAPVHRPVVPVPANKLWRENPIDAFLASAYEKKRLVPRPEASRAVLLRRVSLDLTGLSPTPAEFAAFEADRSPGAYRSVVDRLLASPRYGERWARHWMDVWRYSDWAGWADGNQIRDSKPFIWRWRDWIVESLNSDMGYDRMVQEMLAADELCPGDADSLRATGFLVRNYKLLSREQWLEDTMNHTSRAFLGLTMHCAKCHNHMYDPVTQLEYYRMRAVFEPHNVRTDRVPGEPDVSKDGLVRAFDLDPRAPTYLFVRGDERNPDKSHVIEPGVPAALGGTMDIRPVNLPPQAVNPDRRSFVIEETIAAATKYVQEAETALARARARGEGTSQIIVSAQSALDLARARRNALFAVLTVEKLEETETKGSDAWQQAARGAVAAQRELAVLEAMANITAARTEAAKARSALDAQAPKAPPAVSNAANAALAAAAAKATAAEKSLADARVAVASPLTTAYTPRFTSSYPSTSSGRRLAFARWLTDAKNPLAARVAVNHIWARHFGEGLVPSVSDFGRNGRPPSNPELLDWLAARLVESRWSMKDIHRLIVTSRAYRLASTSEAADLTRDPDDAYLWRFPLKRMEAELVRDNILYVSGHLDETRGGPEIDHTLGLTSRRRSIYLRTAAEKQSEFLRVFDGPSVTECYERRPSIMPQQALALANSELTQRESRLLARDISAAVGADNARFIHEAFIRILARMPTGAEQRACLNFLRTAPAGREPGSVAAVSQPAAASSIVKPAMGTSRPNPAGDLTRARQNLVLVLFNHNDFVTIR